MAYDKIVDSTYLNSGLKSIADAIREKGETTASLAFPTEMAAAIEAIKGGGAGAIANAVLRVSYPVDAVCTVSNGSKTYTALDSSGAAVFVLEPGTWTVTAVKDGTSASKSISLAALEYKEMQMSFTFTLLPNSDITWTAKKTSSSYVMNAYAGYLEFTVGKGSGSTGNNAHFYSTPIDVSGYGEATVHYRIMSYGTGSSPTMRFGFGPDTNGLLTNSSYYQFTDTLSDDDTVTANISALSGMKYFYIGWVKDVSTTTFIVDSIVLS